MNNINNLGDYGSIWKDLQSFDGDKAALYEAIAENAVKRQTPGIVGGVLKIAVPVCLIVGAAGLKCYQITKEAIKAKEKEPELREELEKELGRE